MPVVSEIGLLAEAAPAGGAAIGQVIGMVVALTIGFSALVWLGEAHRRGLLRTCSIARQADLNAHGHLDCR